MTVRRGPDPARPQPWMNALAALLACGCSAALDNPSAYESEAFLCAPELADRWQDEVVRCRAAYDRDRSCVGLVSFSGTLQEQKVTVDSRLDSAIFSDALGPDGPSYRNEVKISGVSPYFRFRFRFWEIGGDSSGGAERTLQVLSGRNPEPEPAPFEDDLVRAALRLSASSQSLESSARDGRFIVTAQTDREQAGTFRFVFADEVVDGCFHAFATERNLESSAGL